MDWYGMSHILGDMSSMQAFDRETGRKETIGKN